MSDANDTENLQQPSELELLKERANKMGITFHPSIGEDKLREKINERLATSQDESEHADESSVTQAPAAVVETPAALRLRKKKEAGELIRCRLTCMNPNKSEWDGEIFTAGNATVGTFKKFVPFNVEWHVPRIIYNMIRERMFQTFVTVRDERGNKVRKGKLIREYNIEVLPNLTEDELKQLAQRQAMAAGTSLAA